MHLATGHMQSARTMESCTASYHAQACPHDPSCAHQTSKEVPHSGPLGPISGLQLRMRETVGISDLIMQAHASSNRPHAKRQNHGIMHSILPCSSAHQTSKEVPHSGPLGPYLDSNCECEKRWESLISSCKHMHLATGHMQSARTMESCTASYHAQVLIRHLRRSLIQAPWAHIWTPTANARNGRNL